MTHGNLTSHIVFGRLKLNTDRNRPSTNPLYCGKVNSSSLIENMSQSLHIMTALYMSIKIILSASRHSREM
jgi:hypothetical protein